jgi:hypothetical protein
VTGRGRRPGAAVEAGHRGRRRVRGGRRLGARPGAVLRPARPDSGWAPRFSVASLRVIATGIRVFIAADISYDYITVHSSYLGGDPVDTLWFVALAILFIAAGCQLRAGPTAEFSAPRRGRAAHPSLLPYLAVAGSYVLLMVVGLRDFAFNSAGGVLLGAVLLTAPVSVRQFTALRQRPARGPVPGTRLD